MTFTKHPIPLKDGTQVSIGTEVVWSNGKATVSHNGRTVKISPISAAKALGITPPDFDTLEYWTYDGICESILGDNVEPDGIDEHGSPSWLLAMGLI